MAISQRKSHIGDFHFLSDNMIHGYCLEKFDDDKAISFLISRYQKETLEGRFMFVSDLNVHGINPRNKVILIARQSHANPEIKRLCMNARKMDNTIVWYVFFHALVTMFFRRETDIYYVVDDINHIKKAVWSDVGWRYYD